MYNDSDLPFLDSDTKMGREIHKCIVAADFDDDCATDEDMQSNAVRVLEKELKKGIEQFLSAKQEGTEADFVKNINCQQRFKKKPW